MVDQYCCCVGLRIRVRRRVGVCLTSLLRRCSTEVFLQVTSWLQVLLVTGAAVQPGITC